MKNLDIRNYAEKKGVRLWQIAERLKINDGNFSRRLRHELSDNEKTQIFKIVDKIQEDECYATRNDHD